MKSETKQVRHIKNLAILGYRYRGFKVHSLDYDKLHEIAVKMVMERDREIKKTELLIEGLRNGNE